MKWVFEPGHTAAEFCVRHMMVSNVRGHFKNISGTLDFDPDDPTEGSVETTIDASTLWTGEEYRDEHLRSDDFLGVEEFPEIHYRGDTVKPTSEHELTLIGDLTIRDETREIPLDVNILGQWSTPYWDDGEDKGPIKRIGFEAQTKINRHDFGVDWNAPLDHGGHVVGDEVEITIDVEALEARKIESF